MLAWNTLIIIPYLLDEYFRDSLNFVKPGIFKPRLHGRYSETFFQALKFKLPLIASHIWNLCQLTSLFVLLR
jgi:hypothetical protein